MNEVVAGIQQIFCYLDDVIIMSESHSEHLLTLHTVFARLRDHGLVVNKSKCNLGVNSLSFLGLVFLLKVCFLLRPKQKL